MKHFLLLLICVSPVLAFAQSHGDREIDERTIRSLNSAVIKAYNMGDFATLDRIEDAEFVLAGDFGEVTKQQQLDDVRKRTQHASTVGLTVENEHFRFYGDTALLTEVEKYQGSENPAGFESTSLWVRRGDNWKLVHLHFSALSKKP